jgi:hypothetical protein
MALDPVHDRLYLANSLVYGGSPPAVVPGGIHILQQARAADPTSLEAAIIATPDAGATSLAVDVANDNLYVGVVNNAYLIPGVSQISGPANVPAAMVTEPAGTVISGFAFA